MNSENDFITSSRPSDLISKNEVTILDVRSLIEFQEGHIWNALHRPVENLPNSVNELLKETLLVTVCNKGHGRSEAAKYLLRESGWKNTFWLEGGYIGWIEDGFSDYEAGIVSS